MEDQNRRYLVDGFPLIRVLDNRHLDSKGQPRKSAPMPPGTQITPTRNCRRNSPCCMRWQCRIRAARHRFATRAGYEALPDDIKLKIADAKTENTLISSARMKRGDLIS